MRINCSINGKAVARSQAKVSVFDNSLFYADGLFETFLALGEKVIFLDDHLDRLERGAKLIGLRLPRPREQIRKWINLTNCRNSAKVKKVRVTATAGDSAFWAGANSEPRIIVIVTEYEIPSKPFRLTVSPFRVDQDSPFRNVKTLSFIIEMTSRKRAYSSRFDDAILLNRSGHVAESTSANIFWIRKGKLYTIPLSAGCLDGLTRKHILGLAQENKIPAFERNVRLADLLRAEEIFVTSSIKLILPIVSIKADRVYKYKVGPLTRRLKRLFLDHIMES